MKEEDLINKLSEDYYGYIDGEQVSESDVILESNIPSQTKIYSFIDNNEELPYVKKHKSKQENISLKEDKIYILLVEGEVQSTDNEENTLKKIQYLLENTSLKLSDITVLKKIDVKFGAYFGHR